MPQTNFYGRIATGDLIVVRDLLQTWLGISQLDEKLKLSGEQLVYETDALYTFAHAVDGGRQFLLEGHRSAELDETRSWLEQLFTLCATHGISAALEYVAVNEAGQEISEQYTVS